MDQQRQNMLHDMNPPRRPKPPSENQLQPQPPPQPQKCPRCDSLNTKFCYYNNYSLTQPRYFCKGCRRYWTQGGTLRNVPVGGGCRKGKRARLSPSSSSVSSMPPQTQTQPQPPPPPMMMINSFEQTQQRGNLGINASSSSSSPYNFPGSGGFLSSLAAMNMRSLSSPILNHHQIGVLTGQGFMNTADTTTTIPNLPQNHPINNDNFCQMEPMFVHQQQNRGLVPPWALSNHHPHQQQQQQQNLQIGSPSFWNSNINRNTGSSSSNNTSSSMMSPNQWLNLPGNAPDSSSSMIDKKP